MVKLNYYKYHDIDDPENVVALISTPEFEDHLERNPKLQLVSSIDLEGDFSSWPTDKVLMEDTYGYI